MYKIPAKTLFTGNQLVFVPECHSTNNELQHLIESNRASDGIVVITDHQTRGRGQQSTVWESEAGANLTLSIGFKPHFLNLKEHFLLSHAVSLGISDMLESYLQAAEIKIKWPNDSIVNGKKICGILIENLVGGDQLQFSVIGIGLNVNQKVFKHAPEATSMALVKGVEFNLEETLHTLLSCIEKRYLQLRSGQTSALKRNYLDALYWRGEEHWFRSEETRFQGVINGIDSAGRLAIQTAGKLQYFDRKQVQYIA